MTEEQEICDDDDDTSCYKCDTEKCNDLGRTEHTCLVCSTRTNPFCLGEPSNVESIRCPVVIGTESKCFIAVVSLKINYWAGMKAQLT